MVDLCAAPGGWSEVVSARLFPPSPSQSTETSTGCPASSSPSSLTSSHPPPTSPPTAVLIAIDLVPISPLPHVTCLQGDITHPSTLSSLLSLLHPDLVELLLCDAAPDAIHQADVDQYLQAQLLLSALTFASHCLRPGGTFVGKVFRGPGVEGVRRVVEGMFDEVWMAKPRASRNSSMEAFVVCRGYRAVWAVRVVEGLGRGQLGLVGGGQEGEWEDEEDEEAEEGAEAEDAGVRAGWQFVSCGDDMDLDAEQTYPLSFHLPGLPSSRHYSALLPSAQPIDPPYQTALHLQRQRRAQPHTP